MVKENDFYETEFTDDFFDEKGRFLIERIYPKTQQKENTKSDIDDIFLEVIAWKVLEEKEEDEIDVMIRQKETIPNFAFIEEYYVPKHLLEKNHITHDCKVKATIVFTGDKWKVTEIEKNQ